MIKLVQYCNSITWKHGPWWYMLTSFFIIFFLSWLTYLRFLISWSHHFDSFVVAMLTWLTVTEYLCQKWPQICSICRNYDSVLSLIMTYHRVCNTTNTTGVKCGRETANPSGILEFTPCSVGIVLPDLLFSVYWLVDHCLSFFFFFLLAIVLYVLPFTTFEYPFGIFKPFLINTVFLCEIISFCRKDF